MKKWFLAVGLALTFVLSACGGGDGGADPVPPGPGPGPGPAPTVEARTTLLVYIVGSDLESRDGQATANIEEMLAARSSAEVNVVLQTGGADKDGWRTVQRKLVRDGELQPVGELGAVNMALPQTLSDFVQWGQARYPAEQYMLVLWNHGGGPNGGYGFDENFDGSYLTLPQITRAVADATAASGRSFELIGFDACLMASVEVAAALRPYARYLAASQDVEPGAGWDWHAVLEHLAADPLASGAALGATIADTFIAKQVEDGQGEYVTFSVTDLARVPALTDALAAAGSFLDAALTDGVDAAWTDIAFARRGALDFSSSPFFGSTTDLADVMSLLEQPSMQLPREILDAVQQALDEAVVYNATGPELGPTSGLTMYFPIRTAYDEDTLARYDSLDFSPAFKRFVANYVRLGVSGVVAPTELGAPVMDATGVVASLSNFNFATGFAVLTAGDRVQALKPAYPDGRGLYVDPDESWFALDGVSVLLLPDDRQVSADDGRFTVPVMVDMGEDGRRPGLLGIQFERDLDGEESYEVYAFFPADMGYSPIAQRGGALEPGMTLYPLDYDIGQRNWHVRESAPIVVPGEDDDEDVEWGLERVALPPTGLRLGVNGYLGEMRFSPPLL